MKLVAVLALACGFAAAPMATAGPASATPTSCDGAGCVPFVAHNAAKGQMCDTNTRWVFGLDTAGNTYICASQGKWVDTAPLIGVRPQGAPCGATIGYAQSFDGRPLACIAQGWTVSFKDIFYRPLT